MQRSAVLFETSTPMQNPPGESRVSSDQVQYTCDEALCFYTQRLLERLHDIAERQCCPKQFGIR